MALRAEYVRAFVEHAGETPASQRLTVRLPTLITVTALIAVGAVVVGVFWNLLTANSTANGGAPIGLANAGGVVGSAQSGAYTAVAGWDCVGAGDHGFEARGRTAQWRTVALGGWSQDGCHGTFETIPMSGSATAADGKQSAQWWFSPGAGVGRCAISVYVPASDSAADTAATAAYYTVLSGRGGTAYADFTIDQAANRGRWVSAGTVTVSGGELAVSLTNRGVPAHDADRIAIAALRVDCSR